MKSKEPKQPQKSKGRTEFIPIDSSENQQHHSANH
jgi:hypothetical protein